MKEEKDKIEKKYLWYDVENSITTSQPTEPVNNISLYQFEKIKNKLGKNAEEVHVINDGPGILYVIYTHSGDTDFYPETRINEFAHKPFYNVDKIGLRSPTAGLKYKVTEHHITSLAEKRDAGTRYGPYTRDNSGKIVFIDDYESGTIKYDAVAGVDIVGAGSIGRSIDFAWHGDFSLKVVTGGAAGNFSRFLYYHEDYHLQKVAIEFHFSLNTSDASISTNTTFFDGSTAHQGIISFDGNATILHVIHAGGTTNFSTGTGIFKNYLLFNTLKVVVDVSTFKFDRMILNGISFDISNLSLSTFASAKQKNLFQTQIKVSSDSGAGVITCYFDNYLFTEDEN